VSTDERRSVWADRRFRLLFVGLSISMVGDSVMLLALAVWVKMITGSNGLAGLTLMMVTLPSLVAPALGWVVDRYRRRPFLIGGHLAAAAILAPLYLVHGRAQLWLIYTVAIGYGVAFVVLPAGLNGLLKELVPDDLLAGANGALTTVQQGLRLFGPMVGAFMISALGPAPVVTIDIVSFVMAAIATTALRLPESRPPRERLHWLAQMAQGASWLVHEPALRLATGALAVSMISLGLVEPLAFAYVDRGLHQPPAFLGVLVCIQGVGAVAGGLFAARLVRWLGEIGTLGLSLLLFGVSFLMGAWPSLALAAVMMPLCGAGVAIAIVAFTTLIQRRSPADRLGRVSATATMVVGVPQTLAIGLGAALVTIFDFRLLFAAIGALLVADGLAVWARRGQHRDPARASAAMSAAAEMMHTRGG
jgi:MFS family permease